MEIKYSKAVIRKKVESVGARACEVKLPPRSMRDWLSVSSVDKAAIAKERRRTAKRYDGLFSTRRRRYEPRRVRLDVNTFRSISCCAMKWEAARHSKHTVTCSWCRHVQLSTEGNRIFMTDTLPLALLADVRRAHEKKAPSPADTVTAISAPSSKPRIRSLSGVATRIAVSAIIDDPAAIDMPKSPFNTTANMQPHTEETYAIHNKVAARTASYSPAFLGGWLGAAREGMGEWLRNDGRKTLIRRRFEG